MRICKEPKLMNAGPSFTLNVFVCLISIVGSLFFTADALAHKPAENLVLITVDGVRWQEVFRGMDERLLHDERFTKQPEILQARYSADSRAAAREKLFPFLWQTIAKEGVIIGNRDIGSRMAVTNEWYFSYPGYNEILTGKADPAINSNKAIPNPNVTFLEWLNQQPGFKNRVMAFGSWDVFPAIINSERSGIPVNAGFASSTAKPSEKELLLNELQAQIPSPWHNVRLDAFTHHYAREALRKHKPRVLYIAYGEPDDFAHDGRFDHYIEASHRFDRFVEDIWRQLQTSRHYRNNTALLIITDHGRGELPLEGWQHHGSERAVQGYLNSPLMAAFKNGIGGADHIWFAALGKGVLPAGELGKHSGDNTSDAGWYQDQLAATALALLGFNVDSFNPDAGRPIREILSRD